MGAKTLEGAVSGKQWGRTKALYVGPYSEVHIIEGKKGGFSSKHSHRFKNNRFVVLEGKISIEVFRPNYTDETILEKGEYADVHAGFQHKFTVLEDCKVLEIYWISPLIDDDIDRIDNGGKGV